MRAHIYGCGFKNVPSVYKTSKNKWQQLVKSYYSMWICQTTRLMPQTLSQSLSTVSCSHKPVTSHKISLVIIAEGSTEIFDVVWPTWFTNHVTTTKSRRERKLLNLNLAIISPLSTGKNMLNLQLRNSDVSRSHITCYLLLQPVSKASEETSSPIMFLSLCIHQKHIFPAPWSVSRSSKILWISLISNNINVAVHQTASSCLVLHSLADSNTSQA